MVRENGFLLLAALRVCVYIHVRECVALHVMRFSSLEPHAHKHMLHACVHKHLHRHTNTETIRQTVITKRPKGHMAESRPELRGGVPDANAP